MASKSATLPTQRCIYLSKTCIYSFKVKEQYSNIFFNLQHRFNIQQKDEFPPPPVEVMGRVSTITLPLINMTTSSISQSHKPNTQLDWTTTRWHYCFAYMPYALFSIAETIKCVSCCNNKSKHILLHNVRAELFFYALRTWIHSGMLGKCHEQRPKSHSNK